MFAKEPPNDQKIGIGIAVNIGGDHKIVGDYRQIPNIRQKPGHLECCCARIHDDGIALLHHRRRCLANGMLFLFAVNQSLFVDLLVACFLIANGAAMRAL